MSSPATGQRGLLDPKLDLVFKRLFSNSPDLLVDLINAVRIHEPPIVEVEILNPQVTPEDITKKLIVLDILGSVPVSVAPAPGAVSVWGKE